VAVAFLDVLAAPRSAHRPVCFSCSRDGFATVLKLDQFCMGFDGQRDRSHAPKIDRYFSDLIRTQLGQLRFDVHPTD
jgi:hypothetical protein